LAEMGAVEGLAEQHGRTEYRISLGAGNTSIRRDSSLQWRFNHGRDLHWRSYGEQTRELDATGPSILLVERCLVVSVSGAVGRDALHSINATRNIIRICDALRRYILCTSLLFLDGCPACTDKSVTLAAAKKSPNTTGFDGEKSGAAQDDTSHRTAKA
jgi:hypothetical protein